MTGLLPKVVAGAPDAPADGRPSEEEVSALGVLGHVMLSHLRLEDARAVFEALAELAPENGYAHRALVQVHLQAGEPGRALEAIGRYRQLGIDDELADAVLVLLESRALWGLGREDEARARLAEYNDRAVTL